MAARRQGQPVPETLQSLRALRPGYLLLGDAVQHLNLVSRCSVERCTRRRARHIYFGSTPGVAPLVENRQDAPGRCAAHEKASTRCNSFGFSRTAFTQRWLAVAATGQVLLAH